MIKKTILFSRPAHLNTRLKQLIVRFKDIEEERSVPMEDIGLVVFEHPQLTYTQSVLTLMAENNCAVVLIGDDYYPKAFMLPLNAHSTETESYRAQLNASEPLKKQLWQQTVKAKILNQALILEQMGKPTEALHFMAKEVRSGDPEGLEGRAAKKYWALLFEDVDFKRERFGEAPNNALNYGYAVLRAAVARSLVGSGLLPAIGIHHKNKYNSFCLADDVMEPYRPFVDRIVYELWLKDHNLEDLTKEVKARLLEVLTVDAFFSNETSPLMLALTRTTASLRKAYLGTLRKINYPKPCA
ncbi:type II CRISPR-associated endonuclease Cas1 [bacterium]|nr:type II CRISPR-associated endonuclease Cas1 [bacterium]